MSPQGLVLPGLGVFAPAVEVITTELTALVGVNRVDAQLTQKADKFEQDLDALEGSP